MDTPSLDSPGLPPRGLEECVRAFRSSIRGLGEALATTDDRPAMLEALLAAGTEFLEAPVAVLFEVDGGSGAGRLQPAHSIGTPESSGSTLALGDGVAGAAAVSGEPTWWPGGPEPTAAEPAMARQGALAVPVRFGGQVSAVAAFYGLVRTAPDADAAEAVGILVRQTEVAIDASYLRQEALNLSLTDGLTGLWNRRHFDLQIEHEVSRHSRFREPFSLLFCDVDDFKVINDTWGHPSGDEVLKELSRRMRAATREVDVVTRYGGDEFTLLLPKTGGAGSLRLANKIRAEVSRRPIAVCGGAITVTISVGAATCPEHGCSASELVAAADAALYRAKAAGGDRVELATLGPAPEPVGGER